MRTTYRASGVKEYWTSRWADIPADFAMTNLAAYPLKYALQAVSSNDGPILEAGCGAGRILRYFHQHGHDITGIDFVEVAVRKLREADQALKVEVVEEVVEQADDGDEDEDEEEVACKELEIGGTVYLLDPESLKVYARESPNGFVGKYDGNAINFDAVDSDDEEEE